MANNMSTSSTEFHSDIDLSVELGLFPVMVPSLFLPKIKERLQYLSGRLPGGLKELSKPGGKEGQSKGDDSEEEVYRVLENYDRDKYMVVFHGTEINKETLKRIRKKWSVPFHFSDKIERDLVKNDTRINKEDYTCLDVRLIKDPAEMKTIYTADKINFTLYIHEKFVAVFLEVKKMEDITEGYAQLQESAALVESVMYKNSANCVLAKILCCPMLKLKKISSEAEDMMTSENISILCDDGEGFDKNLVGYLNLTSRNLRQLTNPIKFNSPKKIIINPGVVARKFDGERVNEVLLKHCHQNPVGYFQLTGTNMWREKTCSFDISFKFDAKLLKTKYSPDVVADVTSVDVMLKNDPKESESKTDEFDFIVIHENFVAVLEVKGVSNIHEGCLQLQQSAALVKLVMGGDIVVNKILCCPKLKKKRISVEAQKAMSSENMFIVCGDGLGFSENLKELLNTMQANKASMSPDLLKNSTQQLASKYYGDTIKETFRQGIDREENVYRLLEYYKQTEGTYMEFFHGTQITEEHCNHIWKDKTCCSPYEFDVKEDTKSLIVQLKARKEKFDFIVIHKSFVAVLEVVGFENIEDGCTRLQQSAALVNSVMNDDIRVVANKILCCPKLDKVAIPPDVQNKLTSENMFIVCNNKQGFNLNLSNLLSSLSENKTPGLEVHFDEFCQNLARTYHGYFENETFRQGDDSEEIVYRELQNYKQNRGDCMNFFHGAQITRENIDDIWKDNTCFSPFDFDVKGNAKTLTVHLKIGKEKFDFIVFHESLLAVLEVKGLKNIEASYIKLQESEALIQSAMDDHTRPVINKILCCPKIKNKEIECAVEMISGNMHIVCDDGNGFETNFMNLLNELQERETSKHCKPISFLIKLTEQIECVYYTGVVKNNKFDIKMIKKFSTGKIVRAMDFFIRNQNVQTDNQKLLTSFQSTKDIDHFNPYHTIYLTPQQAEAYKMKDMILFGAAGTGKTAMIKAKVIELAKSGDKIVIVPSADCNRANFTNNFDNVRIRTPQFLGSEFKLAEIVNDLREIYQWRQSAKAHIYEQWNVMNHLSAIVGVNVGRSILEFAGDEFGENRDIMHALYSKPSRENDKKQKNKLRPIKDSDIATLMIQLEKNWKKSKEISEKLFNESHFFMDDAFSGDTDCHDIVTYFALEWIRKKVTDGKKDQTKYFWIAGDLTQVMFDEDGRSTRKYSYEYLLKYKDEVPGIRETEVCLDAVMRCSKNLFEEWISVRKEIQNVLGQEMFLDNFEDDETNGVRSEENDRMLRAEYGFRYPGSAIVLKDVRNVVDLVKDITNRIKFLTEDKSLSHSSFAVLCCDVTGHKMVINAIQNQFEKDFTQSIAKLHQDGEENKIVLDLAENSVGLEWPVVFVIYSDLHTDKDHNFLIRKYLAYSRGRVRLFVYPELPSYIFKHSEGGTSCTVCKRVKRKKMSERMTDLDPITTDFFIVQFEKMESRNEELVARNEELVARIEELEAREKDRERDLKKMLERLQRLENANDSTTSISDVHVVQ